MLTILQSIVTAWWPGRIEEATIGLNAVHCLGGDGRTAVLLALHV